LDASQRLISPTPPLTSSVLFTGHIEDLECKRHYDPLKAYATSKLAGTMLAYRSARLLKTTPVSVNVVSPGIVNTELARYLPAWAYYLSYPVRALLLRSPEHGAQSVLFAAVATRSRLGPGIEDRFVPPPNGSTDDSLGTGLFIRDLQCITGSLVSRNEVEQEKLWSFCEDFLQQRYPALKIYTEEVWK